MVFGEITPMPERPREFIRRTVNEVIKDIGYEYIVEDKGERYDNIIRVQES